MYQELPLTEVRKVLGDVFDQANQSGEPIVITKNGHAVGVLGPMSVLRPEALPAAYFNAETRARGVAEVDRYMTENFDQDQIADAKAWAAGSDTPGKSGSGESTAA